MNDDLASGFRDVDSAADFAVFSSCLTLVQSIPFFAECKRESYDLLGAVPGRRILDVGCGLGDDAAALARLVTPGGTVVGVDGSRAMIEAARRRYGGVEGLTFEVADAAAMPFDDASFDACRVDRVLQHVADPTPVIREMARVLRPGGLLVAYDNDWETLTVDAADRVLTRTVLNAWCDRFPSGWIGRRLVPLFLQAGLETSSRHRRRLSSAIWPWPIDSIASSHPSGGSRRPGSSAGRTRLGGRKDCAPPMAKATSSAPTPGSWCAERGLRALDRRLDRLRSFLTAALGKHIGVQQRRGLVALTLTPTLSRREREPVTLRRPGESCVRLASVRLCMDLVLS